jgi:hypothetical protein
MWLCDTALARPWQGPGFDHQQCKKLKKEMTRQSLFLDSYLEIGTSLMDGLLQPIEDGVKMNYYRQNQFIF